MRQPPKSRRRLLALAAPLALFLSGCHVLGNGVDVDVLPINDEVYYLEFDKWIDNPGDPNDDEFDATSPKALHIIIADIDAHCGPSGSEVQGSWGTHDTDRTSGFTATGYERRSTTYPDSTMVACAYDHIVDDPEDEEDPASIICDLPTSGYQDDCEDVDPLDQINMDATAFYHAMMDPGAASVDEVADFLANVYDVYYGTYVWTSSLSQPYRVATCVGGKLAGDSAYPLDGTSTSVASAICLA